MTFRNQKIKRSRTFNFFATEINQIKEEGVFEFKEEVKLDAKTEASKKDLQVLESLPDEIVS